MTGAERYQEGEDRYINFATDFLVDRLSAEQKKILRTVANNQRTLIVSGNGVGKSFVIAILIQAFLYPNADSTALGTSGSYAQFYDTMWRPLTEMHKSARENHQLPGNIYEGGQPELRIESDWFAKVVSPRDPGDLEGRHAEDILVVIEEADKEYITEEHFSSAGSSITSANDRMVAVANPPQDESNVVYRKMQSDRWETVQFSTFDSHNVKVDAGLMDDEHIPGLTDLVTVVDDWEAWNNEPWPRIEREYPGEYPGFPEIKNQLDAGVLDREQVLEWIRPGYDIAKKAHEDRDDLAEDWYRRRAGEIPPAAAGKNRPFYKDDVEQTTQLAFNVSTNPIGVGVDVARKGGDKTVVALLYPQAIKLHEWSKCDHNENEDRIREILSDFGSKTPRMAVDAIGEGSGLADRLNNRYDVARFKNGEKAVQEDEYYDKWTEAMIQLGERIGDVAIENVDLREQLFTAARVAETEEKRRRSGDVQKVTPKEEIEERLGHSPDQLDAAAMAAWVASDATKGQDRLPLSF